MVTNTKQENFFIASSISVSSSFVCSLFSSSLPLPLTSLSPSESLSLSLFSPPPLPPYFPLPSNPTCIQAAHSHRGPRPPLPGTPTTSTLVRLTSLGSAKCPSSPS